MKKILIIIVVVCFVALLSFTTVGDPIIDSISQIKIKNPFSIFENKYEINSKQDLVCLMILKTFPSSYSGVSFSERLNLEYLESKYPNEMTMIKRMEASGYEDKMMYVLIPVLVNELSINPNLELFMLGSMTKEDKVAVDEFERLSQNCS